MLARRWRLGRPLDRGTSGELCAAFDQRSGAEVMIRLLPPALRRVPAARDRFLAGARALSCANHPGLVRVLGSGVDRGVPYLVMPRLAGRTLAAVLHEEGRLAIGRAIDVARQLCGALAVVHARGFVHGGVVPDNVRIDDDGRALLGDAGLAVASGVAPEQAPYLAPEASARPTSLDVRADLYALGALFYRMITGRLPFDGHSTFEIVLRQQADPAPPATSFVPALPVSVEPFLARALAEEPARRFQRAEALDDALCLLGHDADALARAAAERRARLERERQRTRRQRRAGALTLAALALAGALLFWTREEPPPAVETAEASEALGRDEALESAHPPAPRARAARARAAPHQGTAGPGTAAQARDDARALEHAATAAAAADGSAR